MATVVGGIRGAIRMNENKEVKLLPCPFCGSNVEMVIDVKKLYGRIYCSKCNVYMKKDLNMDIEHTLKELMAKDWNRRIYEQN